jgi:hypothetical protein
VHKAAVAQTVLASGGVDARNPQPAQVTATIAPVTISIPERFHHRFVGTPEQTVSGSVLPLGQF